MLTHIVMWKYRPETPESVRQDHLAQLRSLANIVPGMERFEVGFDTLHSPRSYDTGLLAHFLDRSVLDAYTVHPGHVKVVKFGETIIETMAKVDFES